ncbi:MAG: hypothetical protein VCA37_18485 [Roseibacillus sp.]
MRSRSFRHAGAFLAVLLAPSVIVAETEPDNDAAKANRIEASTRH